MKTVNYRPRGVCSRNIEITLDEDNIVRSVLFTGGCDGNLQGVSALVVGRSALETALLLEGIKCGQKPTSCPAQLSLALREAMRE